MPYLTTARADTGVTNVTMGIWLFLASEVMLFGALFSAYALLRIASAAWPSGRALFGLPTAIESTALLVLTTIAWGYARRAPRRLPVLTALSVLGAIFFFVHKGMEYQQDVAQGFLPATNTFFASYYALTGLHALHVAGGAIAMLWAWAGRSRAGAPVTAGRVRAIGLYWLFVDLVWVIILTLFYLQ